MATKITYTQGDWHTAINDFGDWCVKCLDEYNNDLTICTCYGDCASVQDEHNARLIAKAPRMLAKLQEVKQYLPLIIQREIDKLTNLEDIQ